MENIQRQKTTTTIREISIQPATLELCPRCGENCSVVGTDYKNTRCWDIKCHNCDYSSYATTVKS